MRILFIIIVLLCSSCGLLPETRYFIPTEVGGIIVCEKATKEACGIMLEKCSNSITYHCVNRVGEIDHRVLQERLNQ